MGPRAVWRAAVVIGSVAALTVAGCASGGGMSKMSAGQAIEKRKALMKEQGAAMRAISAKLKAGQAQSIEPEAQTLVGTAKQIPALFPEGSLDPKASRAKPEIWQKWADFQGYAKMLESKAAQLAATSKTGAAQATSAAVADLGKTTCTACHDTFRGPEIK